MNLVPLSSIFEIRYGHSLELNRLEQIGHEAGGIPFVSRKMGDNGISAYVKPIVGLQPAPAGELTCALSGNGVLSTFVQDKPFYTAFHVACLRPLQEISVDKLLYYCTCIRANRYRYSYGRQANKTLKDMPLPELQSMPAWVSDAKPDMFDGANAACDPRELTDLHAFPWKPFYLNDIFELKKGKRLTKANIRNRPGDVPFIGAIESNNGISAMVDAAIHNAGTLTVNYNGSVAEAFYQPQAFWASDDVNVLYPKFTMTPAIGLFIATLIRQEKYRFSFGRKWHLERMRESQIHLPFDASGNADWDLIKKYINALPFSSQIGKENTPIGAS